MSIGRNSAQVKRVRLAKRATVAFSQATAACFSGGFTVHRGGKGMNDSNNSAERYWQANLKLLTFCLVIWFIVSYLFGIILVDVLNQIPLGGYKLGFWFAQQGSIYVFVALIFFYASRMNKLDREHDVHED